MCTIMDLNGNVLSDNMVEGKVELCMEEQPIVLQFGQNNNHFSIATSIGSLSQLSDLPQGAVTLYLSQPLPFNSTYRFSKRNVDSSWYKRSYDDSAWSNGDSSSWGNYESESIFRVRKVFSISDLSLYTNGVLEITAVGEVKVIINEKAPFTVTPTRNEPSASFPVPRSYFTNGENLIAVEMKKTTSNEIIADLRIHLVDEEKKYLIINGSADENQPVPTGDPYMAFEDGEIPWPMTSYPGSLLWIYDNNGRYVANRVTFIFRGMDRAKEIRIAGINDREETTLIDLKSDDLMTSDENVIDFENETPYSTYRIQFVSTYENMPIRLLGVSLYYVNSIQCEKTKKLPASPVDAEVVSECRWNTVGWKRTVCTPVNFRGEWITDEGSCVDKYPQPGASFIDFVLRISNLYKGHNPSNHYSKILLMLTEMFHIHQWDVHFVSYRVTETNSTSLIAEYYVRFNVTKSEAAPLKNQLIEFQPNVTATLRKYMGDVYGSVYDIVQYNSMVWLVIVGAVVLIIIIAIILVLIMKRPAVKRQKSGLIHKV